MSVFKVKCTIGTLSDYFIVDTGATYSSVPGHFLTESGITPLAVRRTMLADGEVKEYPLGMCEMAIEGHSERLPVYVLFGDSDSPLLLGATALEAFGLAVDSTKHMLVQSEEIMASGIKGISTTKK